MNLFTLTNVKEFEQQVLQFKNLMDEERLSLDEVIKKKQYIQICSLHVENSNYKYHDLAQLLHVILQFIHISNSCH
jgi:hypothetical protein